ncbi:MAG: hypothetical protein O7H41_16100 [Planctomycetota bacterium]|nr:hypothetical protein [Planctomycetota bacterium]
MSDQRPQPREHSESRRVDEQPAGRTPDPESTSADDSLDKTRRFWGRRRGESVTDEDLREVTQNLLEYFRLLHAWDKKANAANGAAEAQPPSQRDNASMQEETEKP